MEELQRYKKNRKKKIVKIFKLKNTQIILAPKNIWKVYNDQPIGFHCLFPKKLNISEKKVLIGNLLNPSLSLSKSGFFLEKNGSEIIFQFAPNVFFKDGSLLKKISTPILQKKTILGYEFIEKKQSQDITQGLPKIESLIDASSSKENHKVRNRSGVFISNYSIEDEEKNDIIKLNSKKQHFFFHSFFTNDIIVSYKRLFYKLIPLNSDYYPKSEKYAFLFPEDLLKLGLQYSKLLNFFGIPKDEKKKLLTRLEGLEEIEYLIRNRLKEAITKKEYIELLNCLNQKKILINLKEKKKDILNSLKEKEKKNTQLKPLNKKEFLSLLKDKKRLIRLKNKEKKIVMRLEKTYFSLLLEEKRKEFSCWVTSYSFFPYEKKKKKYNVNIPLKYYSRVQKEKKDFTKTREANDLKREIFANSYWPIFSNFLWLYKFEKFKLFKWLKIRPIKWLAGPCRASLFKKGKYFKSFETKKVPKIFLGIDSFLSPKKYLSDNLIVQSNRGRYYYLKLLNSLESHSLLTPKIYQTNGFSFPAEQSKTNKTLDFIYIGENHSANFLGMHNLLETLTSYHSLLDGSYMGSLNSLEKFQLILALSIEDSYQSQGIKISSKHIQIVVKQMTNKVFIENPKQTNLIPLELIKVVVIKEICKSIDQYNKMLSQKISLSIENYPIFKPKVLSSKNSVFSGQGFLSKAGFQYTKKILAKASIEGSLDWLTNLKQQIIVGQVLIAGSTFLNMKHNLDNIYLFKKKIF